MPHSCFQKKNKGYDFAWKSSSDTLQSHAFLKFLCIQFTLLHVHRIVVLSLVVLRQQFYASLPVNKVYLIK